MTDIAIADLVPHAGTMCLLDTFVAAEGESLTAEVTIRADSLFCRNGEVGGWVGIEFMAQAVAAWAGWRARQRGGLPQVGFLLGSRKYECSRPAFFPGERLRVQVTRQFQADNGLGQFDCRIEIAGDTVASAALTVFEPDDAAGFLQGKTHE
ncbi:ApeP family dehydratase [Chitinolyticbacter meiyuanensis]|uniref:ApeP family dehydratase n=1 Tax=Chitinolyticbacter meiyuanensis TaxID=682798 RepID=UPI0011E5BC23|nr:hotdog family protein [Chitinolyticbacter meiyuanensis]